MSTVLLIGGTGKTGRRVADRLKTRGVSVRVGARGSDPAFNWDDVGTWPTALRNVAAAYITYHPDIALEGAVEKVSRLIALALEMGVQRLVLLSGRGETEAQRAEQVLMDSGADWTIVRASWFAQNFSEGFFADDITAGELVFPRDGVLEPFIDADDIADVVAAALTRPGHENTLYEVTGPELLTFREALAAIAEARGRAVTYVPINIEEYITTLVEHDVPQPFVELMGLLTRETLDGRNAKVTDGVQRALGRPATKFSDYLAKAIAAGAWQ